MIYKNKEELGEEYNGMFQANMRHGHGKFISKGKIIEGYWKNDMLVKELKKDIYR